MQGVFIILLSILLLSSCLDTKDGSPSPIGSRELIPEPDKAERLRYEAIQQLKESGCVFLDPDTSVLTLKIRDAETGKQFIRTDKPETNDEYRYYSKDLRQVLTLTQHAGDGKYQISIFKVNYSKKQDYGYRTIDVDAFRTEKGIMLGVSKEDVISKLGICYAGLDSTGEYIEMYYRIEVPGDSRTQLLSRHNMPFYYASFTIRKGRLDEFEFGFEYP